MIKRYNELLGEDEDDHILTRKLGEAGEIIEIAVKTTIDSITIASSASMGKDGDGVRKLAKYHKKVLGSITEEESDGTECTDSKIGATVKDKPDAKIVAKSTLHFPTKAEDLKNPMHIKDSKKIRQFVVADEEFDRGAVRSAYKATDVSFDKPIYYVLKVHQKYTDNIDDEIRSKFDVQAQTVAAFLAREFSKKSVEWGIKLRYLKTSLVHFKDKEGRKRVGVLERLLEGGDFERWTNNFQHSVNNPTVEAFIHWSHEFTNGFLMIADVQGISVESADSKESYIFTDPSIHCEQREFGSTNLKKAGIQAFFDRHVCNEHCKSLGLTEGGKPTEGS
eukprot:jgi/Bigna1/46153/estExt_Genewise1.C_20235